jgi:membrane associated rhomboid family serine protease
MASSRQLPNPWWQGGNDDDLKRNLYAEENGDDDINSTASSLYIEEDSEEAPMPQTFYENDRRTHLEGDLKDRQSHERYSSDGRRSSSGGFEGRKELIGGSKPGSGSASKPTNGRSGKELERVSSYPADAAVSSKIKNTSGPYEAVDLHRPQSATRSSSNLRPPPASSSTPARRSKTNISTSSNKQTIKWTCESCTFYNVREFTITQEPTITVLCEMCSTPHRSRVDVTRDNRCSARSENKATDDVGENKNRRGGPTRSKARASSKLGQALAQRSNPRSPSTNDNDADKKKTSKPKIATRTSSTGENTTSTSSTESSTNNNGGKTTYSMSELIKSLGTDENSSVDLPPSLERRVQDFRFAQNKRREKHGDQKPWGIYGVYAHLSDIRADLEWAEDAAWRRHKNQPYLSWRDYDNSRDEGLANRPMFTYAVMALCTIMMFVTIGVNGGFEPLKINPLIGPSSETLLKCGARDSNLIVNENQWFRLFTPMFLHAGLVHYFINILALYFIGGAVEKAHGFASAAVLFVIPAVGGNILSAICLPGFISVGASGGIFGLIGGCMADICLNWNLLFLKTTTDDDTRWRHFYVLLWLAMDIIINCVLGFTPFVDNFTHLGGFLYGFCIGFASIERLASTFFGIRATDESKWSRLTGTILRFFGLIVSIIAIMATTIVLVQSDGVTSPCHGCRYISCVPFPPNADEKWWYCDDCDIVTADIFQSTDGTGLYEQVNINCPNGEIEEIPIDDEGIYDKEELRRLLPSMCRNQCDEVFGSY